MQPSAFNFTIYQGATFGIGFVWKNASTKVPIDLTGWRVRCQIRKRHGDPEIFREFNADGLSALVTDPVGGRFGLFLTAEETSALSFKQGVYDIELIDPAGQVFRFLQGIATLSPEVTK